MENKPNSSYFNLIRKEWQFYLTPVIIVLIYVPVIFFSYGFSDDYAFLYNINAGIDSQIQSVLSSGRPVLAALFTFSWGSLTSIHQISCLRFVSILGIGILSLIYYWIFRSYHESPITAFFQAILLSLTPAIQLFASWATCSFFPFAMVMASLAAYLPRLLRNKTLAYILSMILLEITLLIYQPAAMTYWVVVCIMIFYEYQFDERINLEKISKKLITHIIVWVIPALLAYLVVRIGSQLFPLFKRSELIEFKDIPMKLYWFIKEPFSRSLNIFSIQNSSLTTCLVLIFLITGMFLWLRGKYDKRVILIFISFFLILLSYFPNLIVTVYQPSYRSQVALSGIIIVLFLFALKGITQWFNPTLLNGILLFMTITCSLAATKNVIINIAIPQEIELRYLQSQLNTHPLENVTEIDIIQAESNSLLVPTIIDEFGRPSTNTDWAPEPMIRLILMEKQPQYLNIPIRVLPPDTESGLTENLSNLVIDMRNISSFK